MFIKRFIFILCVLFTCVYVCARVLSPPRGQTRVSGPYRTEVTHSSEQPCGCGNQIQVLCKRASALTTDLSLQPLTHFLKVGTRTGTFIKFSVMFWLMVTLGNDQITVIIITITLTFIISLLAHSKSLSLFDKMCCF